MTKYKLVATAAAGIEALVGKELRNMGYDAQVENGKAFFEGDDYDIARTNKGDSLGENSSSRCGIPSIW